MLGQFELRMRLFKLAGEWISLTAFTDIGDVAPPPSCASRPAVPGEPLTSFDFSRLHVAVGAGSAIAQ